MFCAVRCVIIICCYLLFYLQLCSCMYVLCSTLCDYYLLPFVISNYSTYVYFNILFSFVCCYVFLFPILCIPCFFIVLFTVSPFTYRCPSPNFVQVYRPLSPGVNPLAVNKYLIVSYHIKSDETGIFDIIKPQVIVTFLFSDFF